MMCRITNKQTNERTSVSQSVSQSLYRAVLKQRGSALYHAHDGGKEEEGKGGEREEGGHSANCQCGFNFWLAGWLAGWFSSVLSPVQSQVGQ